MIKLSTYTKLLVLSESMNLYVKGTDYTRYNNLWDLSVYLQRIAYKIIENLSHDQQQYFEKNRPTDLLTIDGLNMDAKAGVLNLYYSGYTKDTLDKILIAIKNELKKLNIKYGEFKQEQSKMYRYEVIRIPILNIEHEYTSAPELNLTNRNAYHIFKNILQFEPDDKIDSSFSFDAHELKQRVEIILKHDPEWIDSHQINKQDSDWPEAERGEPQNYENPHDDIADKIFGNNGARIINIGLSSEDIKHRLYRIWEIADWAIKHGKKEIYAA